MERFVVSSGYNMPFSAPISPRREGLGPLLWQRGSGTETGRQAVRGAHSMGQNSISHSSLLGFFLSQLLPGKMSAVTHVKSQS